MRKKLNSISIIWLFVAAVFLSCKNEQSQDNHQNYLQEHGNYICPMGCEGDKTYPQPGSCPICNMTLQLVEEELIQIISPNQQVLSRQATVKLQSGSDGKTLKAEGFIVPAQNHNLSVAVRFGGRIEKLYVKFSNQYVKKGDKIMDLYSPELRTYQEEHLFLLKSKAENNQIAKSKEKLRLLGINNSQIEKLEKNGTVALTISIYSPVNGYVFFDGPTVQENTSSKNASSMNTMNQESTNSGSIYSASTSQIREGNYVNEGQTLFSVNPLQEVWALVSVSNQFLNQISKNQTIEIISETNPSKTLKGKVALIEQTFEETSQRFARVRIVLKNPSNLLKINSLVTAHFAISSSKNLQVPSTAIYKTGLNAYVWVKKDSTQNGIGIFQVRKVNAGSSNSGMTTIKSGLSPNEEIALQAGMMTDSETFLKEK